MTSTQQHLPSFFTVFFNVVCGHAYDLMTYFDPVVVVESVRPPKKSTRIQENQPWNFVYFFPLLFTLASFLYGNVLLVYIEEGDLSLETLQRSPVSLMHQAMPQSMWPQIDIIYDLAVATVLLNYFTFFRRPYTGGRYEVVVRKKKIKNENKNKKRKKHSSMSIFGKGLLKRKDF